MEVKGISSKRFANYIHVTGITDYDLAKIYKSGQVFTWDQVNTNYSMYIVFTRGRATVVAQVRRGENPLGVIGHLPGLQADFHTKVEVSKVAQDGDIFIMASPTDFKRIWDPYFRLDSQKIFATKRRLKKLTALSADDEFLATSWKYSYGIQLLRQDPMEMLFSYIISQRNRISRISDIIKQLCVTWGSEVKLCEGLSVNVFPTWEQLYRMRIEDWTDLGTGYRDKYLFRLSKCTPTSAFRQRWEALCNDANEFSTDNLIVELKKLDGVGDKVANCIALFAFDHLDAFPIDVWMANICDSVYGGAVPDIESYGEFAGLIQQYMFYYVREESIL